LSKHYAHSDLQSASNAFTGETLKN